MPINANFNQKFNTKILEKPKILTRVNQIYIISGKEYVSYLLSVNAY